MNNGSKKTYSLQNAKDSMTLTEARAAFDLAINKEFFLLNGVKPLSLNRAYLQEIIRTDLDP